MAQHRVGIAGVVHGHVAAHLREWAETEDAEVVAVADPNREERDGYLRRFHLEGIHRYDTIAEMLDSERLDVISVCTQTMRHAEAVVAAAERGVHCIVEKPLSPSLSDADRMLAAANTYGVHVLTTYPSRWPGGLLQSVLTHARPRSPRPYLRRALPGRWTQTPGGRRQSLLPLALRPGRERCGRPGGLLLLRRGRRL